MRPMHLLNNDKAIIAFALHALIRAEPFNVPQVGLQLYPMGLHLIVAVFWRSSIFMGVNSAVIICCVNTILGSH